MKLSQLFENDHADTLAKTGFWGKQGSGCVFIARETGRILLSHRSEDVEQPGTWGNWGGAVDRGENPEQAVRREVSEEAGYHGDYEIQPLYKFTSGDFEYFNWLVVVDKEFNPHLDWETQGYQWCEWGKWPQPLHFGLKALFADPSSARKIQTEIAESRAIDEASPLPSALTFEKVPGTGESETLYQSHDGRFLIKKALNNGVISWSMHDTQTGLTSDENSFDAAKKWALIHLENEPTKTALDETRRRA